MGQSTLESYKSSMTLSDGNLGLVLFAQILVDVEARPTPLERRFQPFWLHTPECFCEAGGQLSPSDGRNTSGMNALWIGLMAPFRYAGIAASYRLERY